jgi:alginate O-acetyltransferase complex protein AlgI
MNFISFEFLFLLLALLAALLIFKHLLARKWILLLASCVFYAWWDWRFLGLLAAVVLLGYYASRLMLATSDPKKRSAALWFSVTSHLAILGFFKYSNFFLDTFNWAVSPLGWQAGALKIILPIGISFYTFEALSYVLDVYKGTAQPANSLLDYAVFITFFPRLVAGPIMRAKGFLPQLERGILLNFDNFFEGIQLFLRGMLKKVVVADNLALAVSQVYNAPSVFSPLSVWMAVIAYSVQILYDFWGYTDMARGVGRMLGFDLPLNFNLPYTSQSVTEFWNRWHISLSSWFRDYVFFPLERRRFKRLGQAGNILIVFLLSGLWHGANWNFIFWGGMHGVYLAVERAFDWAKPVQHPWTSAKAWLRSFLIFLLLTITWVPFRSPNWRTTLLIFEKLLFVKMQYNIEWYSAWTLFAVPLVIVGGWLFRRFEWRWLILKIQQPYALAFLLLEILMIFFFAPVNSSPFIYFQF